MTDLEGFKRGRLIRILYFLIFSSFSSLTYAQNLDTINLIKSKNDSLLIVLDSIELQISNLKLIKTSIDQEIQDNENNIRIMSFPKGLTKTIKAHRKYTLRDKPSMVSGRLTTDINAGENLTLIGYSNEFYRVRYKGEEGLLYYAYLVENGDYSEFKAYWDKENITRERLEKKQQQKQREKEIEDAKLKRQNEWKAREKESLIEDSIREIRYKINVAEREKERKKKIDRYRRSIKDTYGEYIGTRLLNGKYWIGMTREMARISLGTPDDINRTISISRTREQWVYKNIYLYFEDGLCVTIQD